MKFIKLAKDLFDFIRNDHSCNILYRCVKGDIDKREAEVNIVFYTLINLVIGLSKHQLLFY